MEYVQLFALSHPEEVDADARKCIPLQEGAITEEM